MKKTVGLFTNWYPTKENPYNGVFFKEQTFALRDEFDFLIFHYHEHFRLFGHGFSAEATNREENTVEYDISVPVPLRVYAADLLATLKGRLTPSRRTSMAQVSTVHRYRFRKKIVEKVFSGDLADKLDVLYCVDAQSEAGLVRLAAEHLHKPYVISEHGPFPWPGSVLDSYARDSMEKAGAFLAISYDKIRQIMIQNVRLPQVFYVGNMVDESQFSLRPEPPAGHVKTFVIVAANSFYKNYELFIRVMDRLTEITDIPFRVRIVGYAANKGYSQDREDFENRISRSRFADRAELIPEAPHDRIAAYLHGADAFVMTSIQEGQPVSALEAACCGLPVFSTRCGGVEDYVTDELGRIFPVTEVEAFADALRQFLEGALSFDARVIRGRIIEQFGKEAFVKRMSRVFLDVIGGSGIGEAAEIPSSSTARLP